MKKYIIVVCLVLGVSLLSGCAVADYNKDYSDATGDAFHDSVDITRVKSTDSVGSVLLEMWVVGEVSTSNFYAWEILESGQDFGGVAYGNGVGLLTSPGGSQLITVTVTGNKLSVSVQKSYLPDPSAFDVLGVAYRENEFPDSCPDIVTDDDDDGLPDDWEIFFFGDLNQGASDDPDGDGYTNQEELVAPTDPTDPESYPGAGDVDGDGLPDSWEFDNFGDLEQGPGDDYDGDHFTNLQEFDAGTDPANSASHPTDGGGNGVGDGDLSGMFGGLITLLLLIILLPIIIVIVIVVVVVLVLRARKKPPTAPPEQAPPTQ